MLSTPLACIRDKFSSTSGFASVLSNTPWHVTFVLKNADQSYKSRLRLSRLYGF